MELKLANKKIWGDKPYYSLDYYLKETFGKKIYKLSLNGGMTCPNRDGKIDNRGCIFCSKGGSGDFSSSSILPITSQIEEAKKLVMHKLPLKNTGATTDTTGQYIAYFQAFTNTYGPINHLRAIFMEAITHPDISILSIATRPDCLDDSVLKLLDELNQIKPVWVELGLQTSKEETATFIRRGYPLSVFLDGVTKLTKINLTIIVHVILGLPGEDKKDMLNTISFLSKLPIQGIKLQLLHVLKDTDLAHLTFPILSMDEYINIVIEILEILPQNIVIHRITGDGPKDLLIAPLWSGNKKMVLNNIHKQLKQKDSWQGKNA
jgi:radical SAM protein (TIGR01212 family)